MHKHRALLSYISRDSDTCSYLLSVHAARTIQSFDSNMEEPGITKIKHLENMALTRFMPSQTAKSFILTGITIVLLIVVSVWLYYRESLCRALLDTVLAVSLCILTYECAEIAIRTFQFIVEVTELRLKNYSDIERLLKMVHLNKASLLCFVITISYSVMTYHFNIHALNRLRDAGVERCFPAFLAAIVFCRAIDPIGVTLRSTSMIKSMGGLDYGTGLAYSYYYGYLQLILPSDGGQNPGLRHKMEQYETIQNVSIPVKKLFILIPESGHIPPDLKEASDGWLEGTTSLESEVRDRAGVKRRVYKNTVYKIHPGGDGKTNYSVYVTTEGATPMLTLWNILEHYHPQTATYREHRHEIIVSFYETLQTLLKNDPRCNEVCELVYYDDYDEIGKRVNVGEILLRRILSQSLPSR